MAQPVSGMLADRLGVTRVLWGGALCYAAGLALMAFSTTPAMLDLSAGVLIGFGLAGTSFPLVLSAFGKLLKPEWRGLALGLGTAAGSFGQFLFAPFGVAMIDHFGWESALLVFGGLLVLGVGMASQMIEGFARSLVRGLLGRGLVGGLADQASGSAIAFGTTYALGHAAKRYYAGGRKLRPDELRELFTSLVSRSREVESAHAAEIARSARSIDARDLRPLLGE